MNGYIYKITNTVNNKAYIGYTEDPNARWEAHRHNQGSKLVFQAIKKYGLEHITFEVIAEDSVDNEDMYIQEHNTMAPNGYNLVEGGGLPPNFKGKTYKEIYGERAEEQRLKRITAQKAVGGFGPNMHTEETKLKISKATKGEGNGMYGRKHSKDTLDKMSESRKGKGAGADNGNAKTWCLTSPEGISYNIQGNLRSKCEELGLSYATVRKSYELNRPMRNGWKIEKVEL